MSACSGDSKLFDWDSLDDPGSIDPGVNVPVFEPANLASIELQQTQIELPMNVTALPNLHVIYDNGARFRNVTNNLDTVYEDETLVLTWSSQDESIATVSDGTITPVAEGTTIIDVNLSVGDGDFSDSLEVVVVEAVPVVEAPVLELTGISFFQN